MSKKKRKETETQISDSEEIIDIGEFRGIKRVYDYLPYSKHRIERILKKHFGWKLVNVWQGYKANRQYNYHELYEIVEINTERTVVELVSLDSLRRFLAKKGYALYDKKSTGKRIELEEKSMLFEDERNAGAEEFSQILHSLKEKTKQEEY